MPRTRVKVCGITRPEDGIVAARMGADAVGLVFYPPSGRCVTTGQAKAIVASLPPFVSVVGLFLDAGVEDVRSKLESLPAMSLQFHGGESPQYCRQFGRPYIKSVPMGESVDIEGYLDRYREAAGFLVDSHRSGEAGGTGETFDWARLPQNLGRALILAGGLTPGNVAAAIDRVSPYAVDVSSGVESDKGIKDAAKIEAFMRAVVLGEFG